MKISTITRYGLRAMVNLAMYYYNENKYIPLSYIAKKEEISMRYLENIMTKLITAGLVLSRKGKYGGFTLSKSPEKIKVSEILKALEGDMTPVFCISDPTLCKRVSICSTYELWLQLYKDIWSLLDSKTLAQLAKGGKNKLEGLLLKKGRIS